ncbi:hypothetical protein CDAR_801 [Caerostris darwini]|uniref:Uncharacterized protein n=1 Tax=Caerostris darwini TaxID=1538125 RepID=A0AAV4P9F0_9ARAC|nr:hypothetical protein CDAR_801 [Caerostris darwini]
MGVKVMLHNAKGNDGGQGNVPQCQGVNDGGQSYDPQCHGANDGGREGCNMMDVGILLCEYYFSMSMSFHKIIRENVFKKTFNRTCPISDWTITVESFCNPES